MARSCCRLRILPLEDRTSEATYRLRCGPCFCDPRVRPNAVRAAYLAAFSLLLQFRLQLLPQRLPAGAWAGSTCLRQLLRHNLVWQYEHWTRYRVAGNYVW